MEDFEQFATNKLVKYSLEHMNEFPEQSRSMLFFAGVGGKDPAALYYLGVMEMTGKGGDKDVEKGLAHLEKSAEGGNADAMFYLGSAYYWGKEVEQDYDKAFQLLLKAAELGQVEAYNYLSECYQDGKGVEKDTEKSSEWFFRYAQSKFSMKDEGVFDEDEELGDPDILEPEMAAIRLLEDNGLNSVEYSPFAEFDFKGYSGKGTTIEDPLVIKDSDHAVEYENNLIGYLIEDGGLGDISFETVSSEIHWDGKTAIDEVHVRVYEVSPDESEEKTPQYEKTIFFDVTKSYTSYMQFMGVELPDGNAEFPQNNSVK